MDISDVLADFRAEAESLMTDTATWTRSVPVSGPIVLDGNGNPVTVADTVVYSGPVRFFLQRIPRRGQSTTSAGDFVVDMTTYASIPYAAPNLAINDIGVITGSLEHPQDIGLQYRVLGLIRNTQATAQRFQVEAVVG
jgi:hypothetical protein